MRKEARRAYACTAMRRESQNKCEDRTWGCSGIGWCDLCWEVYGDSMCDMKSIEKKVREIWR